MSAFRQLISVVVFMVIVSKAQAQTFVQCNQIQLVICHAEFNDYLSISNGADWNDPKLFRSTVEQFYEYGGVSGLLKVCRAFNGYKMCFGSPEQYNACVSVLGMIIGPDGVPTGISPSDAFAYVKIFTQFDFICGSGLDTFVNNDDCMANVYKTQNRTLAQCQTAFDNSIANDARQACSYASIAASCYKNVFLSSGCGDAAGWWGCEYERVGTSVGYPQCTSNFCSCFLLTWTAAQQTACDVNALVVCDAAFNDALQLPTNANWHNPELFRLSVERYLQFAGVTGVVQVCRAFAQFKMCLGPAQYAACINIPALVVNEVKVRPAYEYIKVWTQFHFTCGAGFNTFLNNDCMSLTWQNQIQSLTNCRHTFDSNADRDPDNVCLYAREAIFCYEARFLQGCPNNPDPGWWACEYERIGTAMRYPQCGLRCSLPSAGGIGKK